jgi:hypothetical protein
LRKCEEKRNKGLATGKATKKSGKKKNEKICKQQNTSPPFITTHVPNITLAWSTVWGGWINKLTYFLEETGDGVVSFTLVQYVFYYYLGGGG